MNPQCAVRIPDGELAVSDWRTNRVHVFSHSDRVNSAHAPENTSDAAPLRSIGEASGLSLPEGLATDGTHLFVAGYGNNRVQQLRISDGAVVDRIGGRGSGDGQLQGPYGLALVRGRGHSDFKIESTSGDRLYVADMNNHRICVFGVSPLRYLTSIGHRALHEFSWTPLGFYFPTYVAVLGGSLYVADGGRQMQVLTLGGGFLRFVDLFNDSPTVIAVRPDGRLLARGSEGGRVFLMTPYGSLLQVFCPSMCVAHGAHACPLYTPLEF